jgi:hypothetical protein
LLLQAQLILYKSEPEKIGITPAAVQTTISGDTIVKPEVFWRDLKPHCPELSKVAQMLLAIPPASATSERVYSSVGNVWSSKRSRMTNSRVKKLLFIYFNRRALQRDGAAREADDLAAFADWLESLDE